MMALSHTPKALFATISVWFKAVQIKRELKALNDRTLADIGIERAAIDDIAVAVANRVAPQVGQPIAVVTRLPMRAPAKAYVSQTDLPAAA